MRSFLGKNQKILTFFSSVILTLWPFLLHFSSGLECNECIVISSEGRTCQPLPKVYLEKLKSDEEGRIKSAPGNYTKVCQTFQIEDVSLSDLAPRVTVDIHLSQMMTEERAAKYERACVQEAVAPTTRQVPLFKDLSLLSNATFQSGLYQLCTCRDKDYCNVSLDFGSSPGSSVKIPSILQIFALVGSLFLYCRYI